MSRLSVVLLLSMGLGVRAGGVGAESLLDVYQMALGGDPRLAAARYEHEATESTVKQARAGLLPRVAFEVDKTDEQQNIISSRNAVIGAGKSRFNIDAYTLTITQPIFRLGAWERLAQTEAGVKQAFALRTASEQSLMVRVATAYLGVLAAKDNLEFSSAEREAVGKQLQLAEERVKRGLAAQGTVHDARARYAQVSAREIEARNVLDDARQGLREIIGSELGSYKAVREDIPLRQPEPANIEKWVETALNQNLALEARRQAGEVALREVQKQRAGHYPTLDLVATRTNREQGGSMFGGGSHIETTDLSLKLNVPIYEGGGTSALTQEAVSRHLKSQQELEQERRAVERQTRAAFQGVISGASQVEALKQGVVAQKSAMEVKQESYKAGLVTVLAVLDAQRDLYMAKRDYAKARYDYLLYRLRLKQAVGTLAESDLEEVNRLLD